MTFSVIDIETLGTNSGTTNLIAMPSVAVAVFPDNDYPKVIMATLNVEEQFNRGAVATASTIAFWMKEAYKNTLPSDEIISILSGDITPEVTVYGKESDSIPTVKVANNTQVLRDIQQWYSANTGKYDMSYGNGNEFDHKILEAHYHDLGFEKPLCDFWQQGNLRSLRALYTSRYGADSYKTDIQKVAVDLTIEYFKMFGLGKARTATKHDPVYDALVEGFEIRLISQLV
ncbi:putative metallopeptidase [Pectobacterium phage DU_PP_V]|uniref:Putative metallopeptidase n=1 Tax=Pectobacterium phage DU_PP_V TaxID=2041492 RepID=A0A2D2W6X4_9CAUD|nr:putative metallopeptidase [Pectobacterium phage DU_PP_V]ATS94051.1 putative metallopeptidase [Pectobacterium phage DU_PP_V]